MKKLLILLPAIFAAIIINAQWETGLDFDGDEGHVLIEHHDALNMTNAMTVEVRVWAEDYDPGGWQEFVFKGGNYPFNSNSEPREYYIRPQNGTGRAQFIIHDENDDTHNSKSDSALVGGQCYHLAGVYDGMYTRMYVNGVLEDTDSAGFINIQQGTGALGFGRLGMESVEEFDGQLDEVRLWNVARSAEEICNYANDTLPASIYADPYSGLVGYWRLDEGEGLTAIDLSPYQAHGVLGDDPVYVDACDSPSCTFVGIPETIERADIVVWPNPTSDTIHISSNRVLEQMILFDASGRIVYTKAIYSFIEDIDIRRLDNGLYTLILRGPNHSQSKKVIIQK